MTVVGPGASVPLWRKIFGESDEIWMGEYDAACVDNAKQKSQLEGINVVTGDQENQETLKSWVETTGGNFDMIIDDGRPNIASTIDATLLSLYCNAAAVP